MQAVEASAASSECSYQLVQSKPHRHSSMKHALPHHDAAQWLSQEHLSLLTFNAAKLPRLCCCYQGFATPATREFVQLDREQARDAWL